MGEALNLSAKNAATATETAPGEKTARINKKVCWRGYAAYAARARLYDMATEEGRNAIMPMNQEWPIQMGISDTMLTQAGLHSVFTRLDQLRLLPPNWDGEDANPIHPQTISNCRFIITCAVAILPEPEIDPNANGTISLEWETSEGFAYLEVGRTSFSMFVESHGILVFSERGLVETSFIAFVNLFSIMASYLYPGFLLPTIEWQEIAQWISRSGETLWAGIFDRFSTTGTLMPFLCSGDHETSVRYRST